MKYRPEGESAIGTNWSREEDSTINQQHEQSSINTDVIGAEDVSETIVIDDQTGQENVFEEEPKKSGSSVTKIILGGLAGVALIGGGLFGYQYFSNSEEMVEEERVVEQESEAVKEEIQEESSLEEEKPIAQEEKVDEKAFAEEESTFVSQEEKVSEAKTLVPQEEKISEEKTFINEENKDQQTVFETKSVEKGALLSLDENIQKLDKRLGDIEVGFGDYASKSMELFTYLNEQNDLRKQEESKTLTRIADLEKRISELSNGNISNGNIPPEVTREEYLALVKEVELLKAKPCACEVSKDKVETKKAELPKQEVKKPEPKNYIRVKTTDVKAVEVKPQEVKKTQPAQKPTKAILRSITNGIAWVEFEGQDVYKTYKVGDTLMGKRIGVIDSNVGIFDVNGNKLLDVK